MSAHIPPTPDHDTLTALVRIARLVLDAWPKEQPVPPALEGPLSAFYHLTDYHGIAPADAPHIPDDGRI